MKIRTVNCLLPTDRIKSVIETSFSWATFPLQTIIPLVSTRKQMLCVKRRNFSREATIVLASAEAAAQRHAMRAGRSSMISHNRQCRKTNKSEKVHPIRKKPNLEQLQEIVDSSDEEYYVHKENRRLLREQ